MKWNEIADETILFFFDEKSNFEKPQTQQKISKSLFEDVKLIQSLADFDNVIAKQKVEQKILFFIHLQHNKKNRGLDNFKASKIKIKYPNLRFYYISSIPKKKIFDDGNDSLDVFSYDGFHDKIGETFIPQTIDEITSKKSLQKNNKKSIFLSHSSEDAKLVFKFRDLILESGLSFEPKLIKFTSQEDFGLSGGINIPEDLKDSLVNEMGLFIQFLTPNYIKSRVCLNEEGAAWCLLSDKKYFIPFIIPPHTHSLISWIKNTDKGILINNRESLMNIYVNRKDFFCNEVNETRLMQKIDEFILYFNNLDK